MIELSKNMQEGGIRYMKLVDGSVKLVPAVVGIMGGQFLKGYAQPHLEMVPVVGSYPETSSAALVALGIYGRKLPGPSGLYDGIAIAGLVSLAGNLMDRFIN